MSREELQKILLVEDDLDIQKIAKVALSKIGHFTVDICSSGQEALAKLQETLPQLILLDVMMPYMDGPETLRRLRQLPGCETIPVIFLTAKVQLHEVAHYQKMGVCDVIAKPFDPMTLSTTIRAIWGNI